MIIEGIDFTLSRLKQAFDSPRERQPGNHGVVFPSLFAGFPKLFGVVWEGFVLPMFVELRHRALAAALPIGLAGVSLGLCKRRVPERGHDVMRRAAGVGEHSA
ncbi:hypothetical protein [Bradyrhizobium ottawaense]|uniref:hypothetical protein n=1 Tax=Bradyrhizobium ottawaense TaxID=931866 RepID=UPI003515A1FB